MTLSNHKEVGCDSLLIALTECIIEPLPAQPRGSSICCDLGLRAKVSADQRVQFPASEHLFPFPFSIVFLSPYELCVNECGSIRAFVQYVT